MSIERQLSEARQAGDTDRVADLLVQHANEQVQAGRLEAARRSLDEAARIHERAGRPVDQARCLVFAATLCRGLGELDQAEERALRARDVSPDETVPRVSAATELGAIADLRQDWAAGEAAYDEALEQGTRTGLVPLAQAALLRKRAQALAQLGRGDEAIELLARAREHYATAGEPDERRKTGVELATALQQLERTAELAPLVAELRTDAESAGDHAVLSDLDLLDASRAIEDERAAGAIDILERARQHALDAVAPIQYTSAVLALAELREADGDRVAAYEALAVGWATLGDLLGPDAARATFEPRLQEQRRRWGDDAFIEARDAYYARRKRELGNDR